MPADEMVGAEMTEYTPDSIREVAEVLAPQAGNYTNAITEQIGQAQQSMGPLAAATMGQSRTAGLGNYTYNRLVRPQVDVMRDALLVQGYTNALNKMLNDRLRAARANYNKSGSGGGNSDKNNNNNNNNGTNDPTTKEEDNNSNSSGSGGYQHAGVADKATGHWIDEEASKKSAMNPEGKDVLSGQGEAMTSKNNYMVRALKNMYAPWLFWTDWF